MKFVGYLNGIPVYEDPNAPPGKLYLLSQCSMQFSRFVPLNHWQRFLATLKRMWHNGRL